VWSGLQKQNQQPEFSKTSGWGLIHEMPPSKCDLKHCNDQVIETGGIKNIVMRRRRTPCIQKPSCDNYKGSFSVHLYTKLTHSPSQKLKILHSAII